MTRHISEFGTLEQRLARTRQTATEPATPARHDDPAEPVTRTGLDDQLVRHVWLDVTVPALVLHRRKTPTGWEGLLAWVHRGELVAEWVPANRITTPPSPA